MQCLREMLRRPAAPFYPSQGKRVDLHPSTSLFAPIGEHRVFVPELYRLYLARVAVLALNRL